MCHAPTGLQKAPSQFGHFKDQLSTSPPLLDPSMLGFLFHLSGSGFPHPLTLTAAIGPAQIRLPSLALIAQHLEPYNPGWT